MKTVLRTMTLLVAIAFSAATLAADAIDLWFAPGWKAKAAKAKVITTELSSKSGHASPTAIRRSSAPSPQASQPWSM